MKILSIETSCDETALAIIEAEGDLDNPKFEIISEALNSQIDIHKEYGGVFPAVAKREHARNLVPLLEELNSKFQTESNSNKIPDQVRDDKTDEIPEQVLNDKTDEIQKLLEREPQLTEKLFSFLETHEKPDLDLITVTSGPGLEPCLWTGINFAKALSIVWQIPLLPVNHMEGHISSILINQNRGSTKSEIRNPKINFPTLALLISGGHTELVLIKSWGKYEVIGQTKDDAVGEAYDKVARLLGLPYPGGPEIAKLAEEAREKDLPFSEISFPRPMVNSKDFDFSFSGLKTAVLYKTQELGEISDDMKKIIAREFEQAIVDVLKKKVTDAIDQFDIKNLIVGGGVISNQYIRKNLQELVEEKDIEVFFPEQKLSTDNAVMIGMAGYLKSFREQAVVNPEIKAEGNLSLNS